MATSNHQTHGYLALCNMVYWLGLTAWVSLIVAVGVAATATFTTLLDPELGVTLDKFAAFEADQHGRIAAGMVMEPVFTFVDLVQIGAALLVVAMVVLQLVLFRAHLARWYSVSNILRMLGMAAAIGLLVWRVFVLMPEMNSDLRAYWRAAESGETETAMQHRAAFDAQHVAASATYRWSLIALLVVVGASAVAIGPRRVQRDAATLEQPKLAS